MPPQKEPEKKTPKAPWWRWLIPLSWVLLGLALLAGTQGVLQPTLKTIPYSEFKEYLARKEVAECVVRPDEIRGRIEPKPDKKGEKEAPFNFRTVRVEDRKLTEQLDAAGVKYRAERPGFFSDFLWS